MPSGASPILLYCRTARDAVRELRWTLWVGDLAVARHSGISAATPLNRRRRVVFIRFVRFRTSCVAIHIVSSELESESGRSEDALGATGTVTADSSLLHQPQNSLLSVFMLESEKPEEKEDFSSSERGVCPQASRNLLEAFFFRLDPSPRSATVSSPYSNHRSEFGQTRTAGTSERVPHNSS